MLYKQVEDIIRKAQQFIAEEKNEASARELVQQRLKNLCGHMGSSWNEYWLLLQEEDMQEAIDENLDFEAEVHPLAAEAAESLREPMGA